MNLIMGHRSLLCRPSRVAYPAVSCVAVDQFSMALISFSEIAVFAAGLSAAPTAKDAPKARQHWEEIKCPHHCKANRSPPSTASS
jgi:hypothetical protein